MWAAHNRSCLPTWQRGLKVAYQETSCCDVQDSPSRRAGLENVTGCDGNDYPLQFCAHRWIENKVVARRAQVVWP